MSNNFLLSIKVSAARVQALSIEILLFLKVLHCLLCHLSPTHSQSTIRMQFFQVISFAMSFVTFPLSVMPEHFKNGFLTKFLVSVFSVAS